MSSLSDFCKHKLKNKPNDVHNIAEKKQKRYHKALEKGTVAPSLYYSATRPFADGDNVVESQQTVKKHVEDREEFPYG